MAILTTDMLAVIDAAHLCFAATASLDGRPNLSPKGTIRAWDDEHVFFLDIASPGTRENLRINPQIEINVVEQLSRRGYRFYGRATLHSDAAIYAEAMRRVFKEENARYPVACVVLVAVERAEAIASPGYMHIHSEGEMRRVWRERRAALDEAFERHVADSPFQPQEQ